MRKLALAVVLLALLLGVMVVPALASPLGSTLARYFPDTTLVYVAADISDGTVQELDGVLNQVRGLLPEGMIPAEMSLSNLLNQTTQEQYSADFQTAVRSWMGDTLAVGVLSMDMSSGYTSVLGALTITDKAKAVAFLDQSMANQIENGLYEKQDGATFTLYVPKAGSFNTTVYAVNDEVIFVASDLELIGNPTASLMDNPQFTGTMALLPLDSYRLTVYLDYPALTAGMMDQVNGMGMMSQMNPLLTSIYSALGAQVYGLSVADGRSFILDFAQTYNDTSALEQAGLVVMPPGSSPVNADFARYIPADAQLAVLGNNLGPTMLLGFQNLRVIGDMIQEQMKSLPDSSSLNSQDRFLRDFNLGNIVTFVNLGFSGATGLNLETDVLPWMTGDYAGYLRLLPGMDAKLPVLPDVGFVVQATDATAAQALVDGVTSAVEQYKLDYQMEAIGSSNALAVTVPFMGMLPTSADSTLSSLGDQVDLLLGVNSEVLASGTRPAVSYSLNPEGPSLADDPAFAEARQYALADTQTLVYLNLRGFVPVIDYASTLPAMSANDVSGLQQARMVLGVLNTVSVSMVQPTDKSILGRFVLTLGSEPLPAAQ
ncbi:MAG: DUF3352 domain-containing protein [Anaerolineae bacterium]|nr:DUF3352 domain-containing protein [Anaerolineae bacterium]